MTTVIVIGGQYGDEGKGKIVDYLTERLKPTIGVRFNGGANAGHSIENAFGDFVLHQIPATIFNPKALSVIGNGVALDLWELTSELSILNQHGVDCSGLRISDRAHLVMPWHKLRDRLEEDQRSGQKIGTTGRGIGPTFADKSAREGLRVVDLLAKNWQSRVSEKYLLQAGKIKNLWGQELPALKQLLEEVENLFSPLAKNVTQLKELSLQQYGSAITLLEGAQGTLLDVDFGTYPMVTSSPTTRLGAYQGSEMVPRASDVALGVFKGYMTRVGSGPFPTELCNGQGDELREVGNEYGATTGRPRRIGWFDAVLARYSQRINGFNSLVLTKSDVLDQLEIVKIAIAYRLDGQTLSHPPTDTQELERCEPVYEELPGWQVPTSAIRSYQDLPKAMQTYIRLIEHYVEVPISLVSIGRKREETIEIRPIC